MKRALLVGVTGSSYLYFLRYLADREEPWFEAKGSEFEKVIFYTADVFCEDNAEDIMKLDSTGNYLKHHGMGVYYDDSLGRPETPQDMIGMGKKEVENEKFG